MSVVKGNQSFYSQFMPTYSQATMGSQFITSPYAAPAYPGGGGASSLGLSFKIGDLGTRPIQSSYSGIPTTMPAPKGPATGAGSQGNMFLFMALIMILLTQQEQKSKKETQPDSQENHTIPQNTTKMLKSDYDAWFAGLAKQKDGDSSTITKEDLTARQLNGQKIDSETPYTNFLQDNFDKVDTNKDVKISSGEVKAAKLANGEALLSVYDEQHNGPEHTSDILKSDYDTWFTALAKEKDGDASAITVDDLKARQLNGLKNGSTTGYADYLRDNFDKVDTNKDGKISSDEVKAEKLANGEALLKVYDEQHNAPQQTSSTTKSDYEAWFTALAKEKDGDASAITVDDLKARQLNGLKNGSTTGYADYLRDNFDKVDTNKDGKITSDEVKAAKLTNGKALWSIQRTDFIEAGETNTQGSVSGDPHFVGFEGETFDVMGQDGHIYNVLSDSNVELNTKFKTWGREGVTVMDEAGITVGTEETGLHQIQFNSSAVAQFDGQELKKGDTKTFDTGLNDQNGKPVQGKATFDGTNLIVNTGEYQIKLMSHGNSKYLDQEVKLTNLGMLSDGVKAHGLLGQTANFDGVVKNGKKGAGAQGEGAIEGVYTDYEVKSLLDTAFKFNKFGIKPEVAAIFGFGTGQAKATS